ncbi:MAG: site-specific integrase [Dokdonella sp.]
MKKSSRISNDRIKHRYFQYLRDADGRDEATIDAVSKSLARFDAHTNRRDFQKFHIEQARSFKRRLAEQTNARTGQPLSKSTVHATLGHLKRFFHWLADQPGFRSRIHHTDVEYFSSSEKDARIATATRQPRAPTLEQIKHVVAKMPSRNDVERRDQALIAFAAETGTRDRAIASMKLKHVDLAEGCIHQDAREVRTKFAKTFDTFFFPVWPEGRQIVEDWVVWLRSQLLFGNEDPLFPATRMEQDENRRFVAAGLGKSHWSDAGPIRRIFRDAFEAAGVPYYNPHSLRHMLAMLGEKRCRTPEEFKAWSQNLGHEKVLTTFNSYGPVSVWRQSEILRALPSP